MAQENTAAPGVNPRDNLTKNEVFYRYDNLDLGDHLQSLAFKHDQAFNKNYGGNIEIPIVNFKGFGSESTGLGDILLRGRYSMPSNSGTLILAGEFVAPTASDDSLGRGQYQLNPVVGMVFQVLETSFVYIGYKHLFSIFDNSSRSEIDESQPRLLAGYISKTGKWTLGDLKYTRSWISGREEVDYDQEFGMMLSKDQGAWFRIGTSWMDSDRDASILIGFRVIK